MQSTFNKILIFSTIILSMVTFWGCSDQSKLSSTEVENEIASISGVVATGYAAQYADIQIISDNDTIANSQTDSSGDYFIQFNKSELNDNNCILINVTTVDDLNLKSIAFINTDSNFILINQITDYTTQQELAETSLIDYCEFKNDESWLNASDEIVKSLFGPTINFNDFYRNQSFKPANPPEPGPPPLEPPPFDSTTSREDVLLHCLSNFQVEQNYNGIDDVITMINNTPESPNLLEQEDFLKSLGGCLGQLNSDEMYLQQQFGPILNDEKYLVVADELGQD